MDDLLCDCPGLGVRCYEPHPARIAHTSEKNAAEGSGECKVSLRSAPYWVDLYDLLKV